MAGQGSARVTLREIDLSQVRNPQQLPQGVPAAVVGPARKGPAFVPQTFATMQQFNEVFGNMLEVGREGNSNQFGPLALNEWMRSAQAGTYLRVLGVGNGLPSSGGKTSEAGFVVGEQQLQLQETGLAKVGDNKNAAITDSAAALALGRTHMLGCFMKDSTGSNFLKDAGIESEGAAASLVVEFAEKPSNNDTFTLDVVDNTGALIGAYTVTFVDGAPGGDQVQRNGGDSVLAVMQELEALLDAEFGENIVTITDDISATGNGSSARMTITSGNPAQLDSTNDCVVKFNLNNTDASKFSVGEKIGSALSQTFSYGIEGDLTAHTEITILKQPEVGSTIALNALSNDGNNTIDDSKIVTYAFVANGDVASYDITAANTASVETGTTKEQTLSNLKAAILDTTDTITSNHRGLFTAKSNATGNELSITQVNAGVDGNTAITLSADNGVGDTGLSVAAADAATASTPQNVILTSDNVNDAQSGFMYGGLNGTETSFTIQLLGQPNENDTFTLKTNDKDADGTLRTQVYRFNNTGANGSSQDGNTTIDINIGESVQETLVNLKYVLDSSHADSANVLATLRDSIDVVLDDASDSVKVSQINPGENNSGIITKYNMTFKISENFVLTNPDGDRLVGNHGEKSENFSGGGGAAAPVIRGVLMTPQGVRAALNPNTDLGQFVAVGDAIDSQIRSVAHGKTFGSTAGTNLTGYVVGEVDSSQGFKLILNGYSNTENPAVLDCSFDPNSPSYFAKVLNTDPTKMEELGHYLYASWDIDPVVAAPSNIGLRHAGGQISGNYENMKGFLVTGAAGRANSDTGKPDYEDFSSKFATARTPWIVSQFYSAGVNTAARPGTAASGGAVKLFRLYAIDDGVISNGQFRLLISNLRYGGRNDYGSFDMSLERFDSDPIRGTVIAAWKNANLDPDSRNFVGRLVGDKHIYYDFESDLGKQRLREEGQYDVKNPYVRIELSDALKQGDVEIDALPTGFQGHAHLFTKSSGNFIEQADLVGNRVFTDAANQATETLSQAQVAPLDFVTSINRVEGTSTLASDDDLAWGVKFALRENNHVSYNDSNDNLVKGHRELSEQVFNKSISSWSKFFPSFGSNPAWITDGDAADLSQNSFFSLEKIEIPSSSLNGDDAIATWDGAVYRRQPSTTPAGRFVKISQDALGGNSKYLKFRCMFQGGFDGVNIFDAEKAELTGIASLREGEDETNSQKFTGPTIMAYQRAIDVLTDKSATEFQLLAIPGQRSPRVTDYAITACEDRFDAMLIMDIVEKDALNSLIEDSEVKPHVRNTISLFTDRVLDTSFAAAYFPDVVIQRPSDNAPIVVPPSVGMLGVMSRNDAIADPWFAPAGLNRGRLSAIDSRVQMNRDLLDDLYDADINPIYVPAGRSGEVYAFGQKTLLQDQSALDRINVRRLLIDIRRKVKKVGEQLLFEPNRASTLSRFSSLVEPIMANVQERRGVTRYKVQIDSSTTTQNDIENNTIRGKIYLQPTKSVEFISLDFVVTNTIQQ